VQELKIGQARADDKKACQMSSWCALIYTPSALKTGGPRLSLTVAILAKGRGYCWGPSASEGPQKHDLTMFLEYNT
jgi:hypothetical protein